MKRAIENQVIEAIEEKRQNGPPVVDPELLVDVPFDTTKPAVEQRAAFNAQQRERQRLFDVAVAKGKADAAVAKKAEIAAKKAETAAETVAAKPKAKVAAKPRAKGKGRARPNGAAAPAEDADMHAD